MTAIERLEVTPYALRFREPYVSARGRLERRELLLVRLRTDGAEGLGEAAPLALRGGPGLAEIERDLRERCWPCLEGTDPLLSGIGATLARCRQRGASLQALAGVDLALHDLAGKLSGQPVWRLLGAPATRPIRCNATLTTDRPARVAKQALRWRERGFDTFKLKLGAGEDRAQVAAVREALGPAVRIRVDANAAWSTREAAAMLRELEPLDIELAEQPVATLEEMAELRVRTRIPLAADESVVDAGDGRRASELAACDYATVKLAKAGGIAAGLAVAAHIPVYLSSALDGPVGIAAAAHAAQALPDAGLAHGLATAELLADTVAARETVIVDAAITPGDGPGLGVEIDEEALTGLRL